MLGNSLASQWLRLCASTTGVMGLISGQGYKINDAQPKKRNYSVCLSIDYFPCPPLSVSFMRAETFPQHLGQCLAQKWPVSV